MKVELIEKDSLIYQKALMLRYDLFFKEHNLPFEILKDENEDKSFHLAAFNEESLVGYSRLTRFSRDSFQISQMVVSSNFQGKGCGSQMLSKLIQLALGQGAKKISLNARKSAIGLYARQGFNCVGAYFFSKRTGVQHIQMVYHANT
ncbi:GNAT family N-acetyltransferase [Saccharophagus degradans]|uniref:GCN5-related N-acetyltransferase n=1 Tax=Saccharophagus degradans (strain 2-40 / ATCC 43961 / DSM 17024) TaxID=203122 RepID=Q21NM6_SACD2|nr:GNAT family N-acetyltransferase [Saccharophagus degradans]ABD79703.1 GCN5-related N-acetyltransferase [Saccharophagus degradans 2-40]